MLSAIDVCDADNVIKALVYAYCKQSRGNVIRVPQVILEGLEFLLYLVTKETQQCAESSILFRADSFSTKVFLPCNVHTYHRHSNSTRG